MCTTLKESLLISENFSQYLEKFLVNLKYKTNRIIGINNSFNIDLNRDYFLMIRCDPIYFFYYYTFRIESVLCKSGQGVVTNKIWGYNDFRCHADEKDVVLEIERLFELTSC